MAPSGVQPALYRDPSARLTLEADSRASQQLLPRTGIIHRCQDVEEGLGAGRR